MSLFGPHIGRSYFAALIGATHAPEATGILSFFHGSHSKQQRGSTACCSRTSLHRMVLLMASVCAWKRAMAFRNIG